MYPGQAYCVYFANALKREEEKSKRVTEANGKPQPAHANNSIHER